MNKKGGRSATLDRWADRVESVLRPHACGLTHAQIADKACLSISTASKALAASNKRGGVIFSRGAHAMLWWHADHKEAVQARLAAIVEARKAREARARSKTGELEIERSEFDRPFVHRVIPAAEAIQLRPRGPASVWGLAA